MVLSCQSISKAFGEKPVLQEVSFHINAGEKVALVGANGAGKTTLLRILTGELEADSGQVVLSKGCSLSYLAQNPLLDQQRSLYEEMLSVKGDLVSLEESLRRQEEALRGAKGEEALELSAAYDRDYREFVEGGGLVFRSQLAAVLRGLGFGEEDFGRSLGTLSGGQKTRIALGKLLLLAPELLLLDEPTNHLDMGAISWLESYLAAYKGAVLLVSHDRYFLDRVVRKVVALQAGRCQVFSGGYSDYARQKKLLDAQAMHAYANQQKELRRQEEVIEKLRSFNREKSIRRAESREKMLAKVERLEKPLGEEAVLRLVLEPSHASGEDVLRAQGLAKSFGDLDLFADVDLHIRRGEHIAILGENGTGKSTLLRILQGKLEADAGSFVLGAGVECGYYDQEHRVLDMDKTLFQEISDAYPQMDNTQIRSMLAAFLFTGDDVFKRIGDLSGGERGRMLLAKLMLSKANFLLLDEPTNHLDIPSREILEEALNQYTGTLLFISHDRYFVNQTAHRIWELRDGRFHSYLGNYDYYLEKKGEGSRVASGPAQDREEASQAKTDWKRQKEEQARARKRENDLKKCEAAIEALEAGIRSLEEEMALPHIATNSHRLQELQASIEENRAKLEAEYALWETLAE